MPAPVLAGLGRSVAAAAQAAARVATAVAQGVGQSVGQAAAAATRGGTQAGGAVGRAAASAAASGAGAAGAATAAPSAAVAAGSRGGVGMSAARAQESIRQGANARRMADHPISTQSPQQFQTPAQSPGQFVKRLFQDWWREAAGGVGGRGRGDEGSGSGGASGGRSGGGARGGGGDRISVGGASGSRGGPSGGGSGSSADMLREGMSRWERIQRGLSTIADVAITAQASGGFTGGRSMAGALARNMAGQVGDVISDPDNSIGAGAARQAREALGIPSPSKAVVDFGFKLKDAVNRLDEFGRGLVEARRPLAELNGPMAAAVAELDVRRFHMQILRAKGTSASAAYQTRQQGRLEENLMPVRIWIENATNKIVGVLQATASLSIEALKNHAVVGPLLRFLQWSQEQEQKGESQVLIDFARNLAEGNFNERRFEQLPPMPDWNKP